MKVIVEKDLKRWKLARNADGQGDSAIFWRAAQQSSANLLCVYPMSLQSHACTRLRKFTPVCKRRYTRMHPSSLWEQAIGVRPVISKGRTEQLCWVHAMGAARTRGWCSCVSRSCCGGEKNQNRRRPRAQDCMYVHMYEYVYIYVLLFVVQLLRWLFATLWLVVCQASLSFTISWSLLKLVSVVLMMPSNHLILCRSLLLLPSIFPIIRFFSQWVNRYWVGKKIHCGLSVRCYGSEEAARKNGKSLTTRL